MAVRKPDLLRLGCSLLLAVRLVMAVLLLQSSTCSSGADGDECAAFGFLHQPHVDP